MICSQERKRQESHPTLPEQERTYVVGCRSRVRNSYDRYSLFVGFRVGSQSTVVIVTDNSGYGRPMPGNNWWPIKRRTACCSIWAKCGTYTLSSSQVSQRSSSPYIDSPGTAVVAEDLADRDCEPRRLSECLSAHYRPPDRTSTPDEQGYSTKRSPQRWSNSRHFFLTSFATLTITFGDDAACLPESRRIHVGLVAGCGIRGRADLNLDLGFARRNLGLDCRYIRRQIP